MTVRIITGDCRDVLCTLPEGSVDAIVTDPPYEFGFMGKGWDATGVAFDSATWEGCLRVLKPGAHLLAFGGTRTYHRMACAIEDAGFEIRDQIGWTYGSGFPKSLDVSKAIDKAAGAERAFTPVGKAIKRMIPGADQNATGSWIKDNGREYQPGTSEPATEAARQWQGWGTALKPAFEPVVVATKPHTAQHQIAVLAQQIGETLCRVGSLAKTDTSLSEQLRALGFWSTASSLNERLVGLSRMASRFTTETAFVLTTDLRTLKSCLSKLTQAITTPDPTRPDGIECSASDAVGLSRSVLVKCERLRATTAGEIAIDWSADEASDRGARRPSPEWESIVVARKPLIGSVAENVLTHGTGALNIDGCRVPTDDDLNGGAYSTERKPSASEWVKHGGTIHSSTGREYVQPLGRWPANLTHDGSEEVLQAFPDAARFFYCAKADAADRGDGNTHPTVKPGDLMRYLCRLVTPPGGTVLDPFTGSGSTLLAADREGFNAIGIELLPEYADIARRRIHRDAPLFAEVS